MTDRFFNVTRPDRGLAPTGTPAVPVRTRLALVVGNAAYPQSRLLNPTNDAKLVAAKLASLGFQVDIVLDAGKAVLEHALVSFGQKLEEAGPQAISFFYFAGHGLQQDGRNYFVPVDAVLPGSRYLRSGAVPVDFLVDELSTGKARANVIVIDACRHGLFQEGASPSERLRGLASIGKLPNATLIAFSTAADTVAKDGDERHSPYASALARRLVDPALRLQDMFFAVARDVASVTSDEQRPAIFVQGGLPDISLGAPDQPPGEVTSVQLPDKAKLEPKSAPRPATAAPKPAAAPEPVATAKPEAPTAVPRPIPPSARRREKARWWMLGAAAALVSVGVAGWLIPQTGTHPTGGTNLSAHDICCGPAPWLAPMRAGRWGDVERAAAEKAPVGLTLLGAARIRGSGADAPVRVSPDLTAALHALREAAARESGAAHLLLAGLYDHAATGVRDRDLARAHLRDVLSSPEAGIHAEANRLLARLELEDRLGALHADPIEASFGRPDAPVQLVAYVSYLDCPACDALAGEVIPALRAAYIDAGRVRVTLRPFLSQLAATDAGLAAARLVACAPVDQRATVHARIVATAPVWSTAEQPVEALEMVLKPLGLGRPRSTACLEDAAIPARLRRQAEEARVELGLLAPPALFVNGRVVGMASRAGIEDAVHAALPVNDPLSTWRK